MEQTRFAPFPFLLLSRELRDNIYEHLLTSPRALPSWPEDRNHWRPPSGDEAEHFELANQYPVQDLKSDTTALQLTCHQIYGETQAAIVRLDRKGQLPFRLDLMMVDEIMLDFYSEVPISCRLSNPIKKPYVRELAINIVTPSPVPAEGFIVELNLVFRNLRAGKRQGLMDPETVLELMTNHMRFLLSSSCYTAKYAKIIFQRMERITFALDGHPKQSWDLLKVQLDRLPECVRRGMLLLTMI
ncbi:MAG: hypothetical protein Q9203_006077 [Teloschistes exilis]